MAGSWIRNTAAFLGAIAGMVAFPFVGARTPASAPPIRATLFKNAQVYTLDPVAERVEAFAVRGGKIVARGSLSQSGSWGPFESEIDLGGRLVLPGFHDNHVHPIDSGVEFAECRLYSARDHEELFARLRDCDRELDRNIVWLRGSGWHQEFFGPTGPNRAMLDSLGIARPIVLMSSDGHSYWANSRALEMAGIGRATTDPRDGKISRTADGEATGLLIEGAMSLLDARIPRRNARERAQGLRTALRIFAENGITSFKEAYSTEEHLQTYRSLEAQGELSAKVAIALYADSNREPSQIDELVSLRRRYQTDRIRITTIKIFLDGVSEDRTAAMIQPNPIGHESARVQWDRARLFDTAVRADRAGFQLHFHAIGDYAVRLALDTIEEVRQKNGVRIDLRHEIAHLEVVHPDDWLRFARLNVTAVFSPLWAIPSTPAVDAGSITYPIGSILRARGRLSFGSDWAVTSVNPLEGIHAAVTRTPSRFRITVREAIDAYTHHGAYATFRENDFGRIAVGKSADFIVLDRNFLMGTASSIVSTKIWATYLEGRRIFPAP